MPKEWWEDFFSGVVLDLWKGVYDEQRTKAEANFTLELLSVPHGAAILDVPCGEGRLAGSGHPLGTSRHAQSSMAGGV